MLSKQLFSDHLKKATPSPGHSKIMPSGLGQQLWYEASFLLRLVFIFSLSLLIAYGLRVWLSNQELSLVENQIIWSDSLAPSKQFSPSRPYLHATAEVNAPSQSQQKEWPFIISKSHKPQQDSRPEPSSSLYY